MENSGEDLARLVKAEARRLGFTLVGVTSPEPPAHLETFFAWLQAGRHGEMEYLARESALQRRADPRMIMPECRSILVLGMRYWPGPELSIGTRQPGQGKIAAYAWGEDYHDVLPARMLRLGVYLDELVGRPVVRHVYTDSSPLLERELGQRAGLGWIGKNTCLIHPEQGSFFFLAEMLLGIDLLPDPPFLADRCGTCRRCLDACPTGCILPDRTLDARRCIAYLTIELKGAIPLDLRPMLGEWVFGCDICQQVCPWNGRRMARGESPESATVKGGQRPSKRQSPPVDKERPYGIDRPNTVFAPRPDLAAPDLVAELELDAQGFNRKFRGSPLKRAKRRGYLRNVAVALGNALAAGADLPGAVLALERLCSSDPEELVREHAAWALAQASGQ